ncbi:receptor-type tyrosine-protein phosphatase F-like [Asterias rubens]|uniref:receptor-type tyrosine-protein phosphatase F-like n=1 Tax=Asterias rubens TaxID=7604 RepID=UPI001455363A|nr:receptor-type tyrosine-protein phosphatase F-like [Asterias rubens]
MYKVLNATTGSVGVFNWTYGSNTVKTIRMRSTATLLPIFVTRTVNLNDNVSLTVKQKIPDEQNQQSRWRKDGGDVVKQNTFNFDINNANTDDSGIYECHYQHKRGEGNQALLRLIVRGCPKNKHGPPDCRDECPRCLNGGICDDVGGGCICPPGFGGRLCGRIKGPNSFGRRGGLRCDAVGLPHDGSTCKGMLFCLPDPYGCSCAAGYQGLECKTGCTNGTYGANCAQICHCAEGVSCNGTTGECDGDCAAGYKGDNCQIQCTSGEFGLNCAQTCHCADASCDGTTGRCDGDCASGYTGDNCQVCIDGKFGVNCAQNCHCADGASCDGTTGECDGDCAVGYKGDSCQVQCASGQFGLNCNQNCHCADASCDGTTGECEGNCAAGYTGDNCQDCIDGKFGADCAQTCHCADSVSCDETTGQCSGSCAAGYTGNICQEQCLPYEYKLSCSTTCTILDPNIIPQRLNVSSYSADDSFTHTLSWEPVMCPSKGFSIVNYVYKVLDGRGSEVELVAVESTSVSLHLTHCTRYQLEVAARTSKGIGNFGTASYTTKSKVPNQVANVAVSPIGHNQLTVSWDAPLTDNQSPCPATDYLVTYDLINLEQCQEVSRDVEILTTTYTTITINRLDAFSTYRVTVTSRNQAGSSTPVYRTVKTTQSIPGAPTVIVDSTSTDYIEFAWELPCGRTGGNITEYPYKYKKATDNEFIQPITTTDTRIRITFLTPCTSYVFQVRALNNIGRGPWSNEARQNTTQKEPLGVKNLSVKPGSQGILVASWEDKGVGHTKNPCLASNYHVTYELINLDQCGEGDRSGASKNTKDTTTTVEGLHPYSTYRINVTSRNEAGDGPTKSKSAITTERSFGIAPTFNSSRVTSNTISITWNPIPCGSRGVRITSYVVSLSRQDGQSKRDNLKQVPNTSVSAQFDQLFPCTTYIITVTTIQLRGEGTSFSREIETDTTVPEAVTGLTISRIRHDQLEVSWTAPGTNTDNPCLAADYLVTYELTNLEQCQKVDDAGVSSLNTPDTSVIIEGLKAHSTYRVYVTPRNEAGNGTATTSSKITGEKSPQAAPTFNRSEVTASSISITWNPIPCGSRGGSITGYISKLFLKGNIQIQDDVIGESTSVQFDELAPCTNYTIAVTTDGTSIGTSFEREETTYTVAPGRVTVLRANPTSDATQIHVTWLNPNANDCPVSKYKVEYQLLHRDQCVRDVPQNREQWLDGSQSPTTITGLYPHSTYHVYVTPSNSAGAGEEASVLVTTNSTAPSGPPSDLKFFDVTNQTISFSWKRPVCGQRNGIITQYHYSLIDSEEGVFEEDTTSSTGTEFTGLVPFMSYKLSVSAENQFASGPVASITTPTQEGIPPPPSKVTFPVTRSDMITVAWNAPSPPHGIIISYDLRYWKTGSGNQTLGDTVRITKQLSNQYQRRKISNLEGSISYSVQVRAETSVGHGPWSDISTVTTDAGEPSQPRSLIATAITQTSITLSWEKPQYPNGRIVHYIVEHRVYARPYDRSFNFYSHAEFWSSKVLAAPLITVIGDLEPSTQYEVRVQAVNNANITGNITQLEVFTELPTDLTPPDKPALIGAESSVTHLTLRLASTNTSKYTSSYQIGVKSIADDSTLTGKISKRSAPEFLHHDNNPSAYVAAELPGRLPEKFVVGDNKTYGGYWNPPLQEGAVYEIYVGAVSRINETKASVVWNDEPLTVEVDGDYSEPNAAGSVVAVILILLVLVIIVLLAAVFLRKWKEGKAVDGHNGVNAASQNPPDYEDIELSNRGCDASADKVSRSSTDHSSGQSASIPGPSAPKSPTKDQSGAGPSTSTKPTIKQKPNIRSRPKSKSAVKGASGSSTTGVVTMTDLARFIKARKSGKINAFQQDFETLPAVPNHPQTEALDDANKKKNRYKNISAYDHSRVVLEPLEGHPHSDYINACYIDGYKYDAKYIACQGPNQTTVIDMWRMVWQERVGKIIMLTNLVENGKDKCEKYWPDEKLFNDYGEVFVRNVEEKKSPTFILRTFHLSKSSEPEGEYREVLQYHYITWPDMKPPESSSLLQFIGRVHASETTQHGPTIVHCSAGVGRTGTYIALDAMMEQAQAEGQVDVLSFVRNMRDKRYLMVQTVGQFKFIYEALLESSLSENTAISVDRFPQDLIKLKKRDKKTGTNGMEDQFQMLDTFTASMSDDQCYGGRQPDNADKNRFEDCIPRDSTRPYLMTTGDEGSTNYINATFLEGSRGKHSYLATQAPLPSTMGDIWRLVFDYKSSCIIMLNSMDNDPQSIPQYWPEEGSMSFGPLTVQLLSEDQRDEDMVVRQFGITYPLRNQKEVQTVCHIQFLQWPKKKDIPSSPSSLLKLIEAVNTWTEEHPDGPLTVHCIDGEGCSGTFCTLVTLLDRLEQDGVIDVFQAVKKLRSTRAGMVKTLAQYQLCYQVVKSYLDEASSSTIYENVHR